MDTSDEWIRERTGISKRHIAAGDETACDLAEEAATQAMQAAGRTPRQVDLIVLATTTPDRVFPSTACLLQQRLDIHGTAAFDVQAVCTGFIYALSIADKFIRTGSARCGVPSSGATSCSMSRTVACWRVSPSSGEAGSSRPPRLSRVRPATPASTSSRGSRTSWTKASCGARTRANRCASRCSSRSVSSPSRWPNHPARPTACEPLMPGSSSDWQRRRPPTSRAPIPTSRIPAAATRAGVSSR